MWHIHLQAQDLQFVNNKWRWSIDHIWCGVVLQFYIGPYSDFVARILDVSTVLFLCNKRLYVPCYPHSLYVYFQQTHCQVVCVAWLYTLRIQSRRWEINSNEANTFFFKSLNLFSRKEWCFWSSHLWRSGNIITEFWKCLCNCNKIRQVTKTDIWTLPEKCDASVSIHKKR
jgi:hypothetical protein